MSEVKNIKIGDFSYHLPEERIAKYPLGERDSSSLLIWDKGSMQKDRFSNISSHLPPESMLIFNNTRVIHARLFFRKTTGATIEIFCLEPVQPADHQLAFQQTGHAVWKCMAGNAKKWKNEELVRAFEISGETVMLTARKAGQEGNAYIIEFSWPPRFTFGEIIEKTGILPIPPYLKRAPEPGDEITYQTVYAKTDGSVAAPTAGLHFTQKTLDQLRKKNIDLREITLHVGAGTFQPVKSETIDGHTMHRERVIIPRTLIEELARNPRKIIAVGTTSVRSLESLYWLGLKLEQLQPWPEYIETGQWEPYGHRPDMPVKHALENILKYLESQKRTDLQFSTQVIIVPGYEFKMIEGMITNFHQPQSTLLLLIGAFLGPDWRKVYDFALENEFRFLSYGDSNLYLK